MITRPYIPKKGEIKKREIIDTIKTRKYHHTTIKINKSKHNITALFLIGKCNNNCIFCSIPEELKKDINLSLEGIKKIIDSIDSSSNVTLDFCAMEPTVHPNIVEALQYADKKKLNILLATNARLFSSNRFMDSIKDIKMKIRSSLHGHNAELHDSLTRSEGSFIEAIKGFKNIIKHGIPLSVNIVINKKNIYHLKDIVDLLINIGVKRIKFSGLVLTENMRDKRNHNLIVGYDIIKKVLPDVLEYIRKKKIGIRIEKLPVCIAPKFSKCFLKEEDTGFIKLEDCSKCKYGNDCMGIHEGYINAGISCPICVIDKNS